MKNKLSNKKTLTYGILISVIIFLMSVYQVIKLNTTKNFKVSNFVLAETFDESLAKMKSSFFFDHSNLIRNKTVFEGVNAFTISNDEPLYLSKVINYYPINIDYDQTILGVSKDVDVGLNNQSKLAYLSFSIIENDLNYQRVLKTIKNNPDFKYQHNSITKDLRTNLIQYVEKYEYEKPNKNYVDIYVFYTSELSMEELNGKEFLPKNISNLSVSFVERELVKKSDFVPLF